MGHINMQIMVPTQVYARSDTCIKTRVPRSKLQLISASVSCGRHILYVAESNQWRDAFIQSSYNWNVCTFVVLLSPFRQSLVWGEFSNGNLLHLV